MIRRGARWLAPLMLVLLAACASPAGAPDSAPSAGGPPSATATRQATAAITPAAPSATSAPTATATATLRLEPAPPGSSITVSAVGDISLARQVVDRMEANGAGYPFALIAPLVRGDIGLANLEGALTERGEPWPKGYNFRTPPRFASGLSAARFRVVTLANNHTLDYGQIGLLDTLAALDAAHVRHVGAGVDAASAHAPVIVEVNGLRVAFLGYVATPDEGGGFSIGAWAAGPATPGLALGTPDAIATDVAAARQLADFVIVAVHAGDEYRTAPNATQRALAQAALDAGADAYIGAHAHVVQPIELRGGKLIAWGLGNFIFDLDEVDLANIPAAARLVDPRTDADEGRRRDGVAGGAGDAGRGGRPPAPGDGCRGSGAARDHRAGPAVTAKEKSMDLGLRDRVAIVGGASQGIGRATAKMLAAEGCRVVMAARSEAALERCAESMRALLANKHPGAGQVLGVPCDMSVHTDIKRLVARTVAEFGGIDIIVNNAGGPPLGTFEQHGDDAWRKAFDTNLHERRLDGARGVAVLEGVAAGARHQHHIDGGARADRGADPVELDPAWHDGARKDAVEGAGAVRHHREQRRAGADDH